MKIKNTVICILTCYMLLGCAGPYSEKDNGKTIELSEDDGFQINLMGEEQSDFTWQLVSKNENIKMEGLPIMKVTGKNKKYTFNFATKGYGEDIVRLEYTNGKEIEKSYELKIIIGTMGRVLGE